MESRTYIRNVRITPKKLRLMLPAIKSLSPAEALDYLMYTPKKGARVFYKAIKSAIASAKQTLKAEEDLLKFKTLLVEEGHKLKRFKAGGRGTAKPYARRFSHIKIILEAKPEATALESKEKKRELKAEIEDTIEIKNSKTDKK